MAPASEPPTPRDRFNRVADRLTAALGSIQAVVVSVVMVVVWAITGPFFGFSDGWQLGINTSTTVITFWMVFVIQNSQGRDARAIHLKLDEIIRASAAARNEFIVAEQATEAEVARHESELRETAADGDSRRPDSRQLQGSPGSDVVPPQRDRDDDPQTDIRRGTGTRRQSNMDQVKRTGREVETEVRKGIRDLDGHDLGDDLGNAGDEVKKDLGNLGDDLRREGREIKREVDDATH